MSDLDTTALGRRVRLLRTGRDLSQRELAARTHVSAGYIGQIETGKLRKRPSDEVMQRLAGALDTPPSDLYAELGLPIEPPTNAQLIAEFRRITGQLADLTRDVRDLGAKIGEQPEGSGPDA